MKIAVDLDGTLADLHKAMNELSDHFDDDSFLSWEKEDDELFRYEARRVWNDHWDSIEPTEPNVNQKTEALNYTHDVDIVTNCVANRDVILSWLDKHSVVYDDLVMARKTGRRKRNLEYDVYVDDKPGMVGTVDCQYVPMRPWNETIRTGDDDTHYRRLSETPLSDASPLVIHIASLNDVIYDLSFRRHNV